MKLGSKAIQQLAEWGAFQNEHRDLKVENDQCAITGQVSAADNLSCSLGQLRLTPRAERRLTAEELEAWGTRVAKRVRYMLEAIETVELDRPHGRLLLRSTPPEKKADGSVYYYELQLNATGMLAFERRRFDPKSRARAAEPMHCTRELLEKLVDDLAASVA
jgi:hypothetical protein